MTDRTLWPGTWHWASWIVPTSFEEDAIGLASLEGCEGAWTRQAGPGRTTLEAWYTSREALLAAMERLAAAGYEVREGPEEVKDEGWLAATLAPRAPLRAGPFVVCDGRGGVCAPEDAERHAIVLPPGRAFGTGEHETTRLCLELLGECSCEGARVLDLGTGSGILAIGAALAGAAKVAALDNDPRVLDVAQENVEANGVGGRVAVAAGSWTALAPDARFSIILANIHRSALVRSARSLSQRLESGGRAILSGFAPEDAERVAGAWASAGLREVERRVDGEWCACAWENA